MGIGRWLIDEDVREEYWVGIRKMPENVEGDVKGVGVSQRSLRSADRVFLLRASVDLRSTAKLFGVVCAGGYWRSTGEQVRG